LTEPPLELVFTVACPPEHAFSVWAERTPAGDEHDWGEVLEWDPPRRLAYRWHLRQDREDASRVEISFAPAAEGIAVTIVHSDWRRLGQRERNERGWAGLVPHYAAACTRGPHAAAEVRPGGR
jgi:uncharacterized protein YndB with AHSA1/START domain